MKREMESKGGHRRMAERREWHRPLGTMVILLAVGMMLTMVSCGKKTEGNGSEDATLMAPKTPEDSVLAVALKAANGSLPIDTGGGIVVERVEVEGPNVSYVCTIDEKQGGSVEQIVGQSNIIKEMLIETLRQADPEMREFLRAVVEANKNICYSYRGLTSGQQYDIIISTDELRNII